jgi:hypothetical protein
VRCPRSADQRLFQPLLEHGDADVERLERRFGLDHTHLVPHGAVIDDGGRHDTHTEAEGHHGDDPSLPATSA